LTRAYIYAETFSASRYSYSKRALVFACNFASLCASVGICKILLLSSYYRIMFTDYFVAVSSSVRTVCVCIRTLTFELTSFYLDIWRAGSS